MPESKPPRRKRVRVPGLERQADPVKAALRQQQDRTPRWYLYVMVALMVVGLAMIVTTYVTRSAYPIPGIGPWNIAVGFGVALIGFGMTTRWRGSDR